MHRLLKISAIAIGATLAAAGTASAHESDRNQSGATVTFSFGDVAYGYRDGYWDHDRRWHRWQHVDDRRRYRSDRGSDYHHWNHTRERHDGWRDRDDYRR